MWLETKGYHLQMMFYESGLWESVARVLPFLSLPCSVTLLKSLDLPLCPLFKINLFYPLRKTTVRCHWFLTIHLETQTLRPTQWSLLEVLLPALWSESPIKSNNAATSGIWRLLGHCCTTAKLLLGGLRDTTQPEAKKIRIFVHKAWIAIGHDFRFILPILTQLPSPCE